MRPGPLFIVFICILMSCSRKEHLPKDILSPADMEDVLWDLSRTDQWLAGYVFPNDSSLDKKLESIKMYEKVFSLHHISKEDFEKSFAYYKAHGKEFKSIMDSLNERSNEASIALPSPRDQNDTSIQKRYPYRILSDSMKRLRPVRVN